MRQTKKLLSIVIVATLFIQLGINVFVGNSVVAEVTNDNFQVSTGVKYNVKQEKIKDLDQSLRIMEVDLQDSFTQLDIGLPNPLNTIATTSKQAIQNSSQGHQVVGAINAGFYDTQTRLPMYLISYNNELINAGIVSSGRDQYVNEPIAFGVTSDGKALIDQYTLNLSLLYNNVASKITSINKVRTNDNLIVYTPEYGANTNSNQYGMEVVITGASKNRNLSFGDVITGTVSQVKPYGDTSNTPIPEDGFVLSAHGTSLATIKNMKVGETVTVSINIDEKWKDSKFMLASGPMLVNNGKVELSIDENSSRARERAPRTAVAVDKSLTKVFFVTVDGRQPGYSQGMNLKEFAEYLVKIGAYKALNLDGGGSTTMVARKYGDQTASLINSPSDGRERAVSTTLQAISSAPVGQPKTITATLGKQAKIVKGSAVNVQVNYILDQYYNSLIIDSSKLAISADSSIGTASGKSFTATKAGQGNITATYGTASINLPVTVVDSISRFSVSPTSVSMIKSGSQKLTVKAYDSDNNELIFDPKLLKWSVSNQLGTVSPDGIFQAGDVKGEGTITATYGKDSVKIPVQVGVDTIIFESFDSIENWSTTSVRATGALEPSKSTEPIIQANGSAKLQYEFLPEQNGTAATYVNAIKPITLIERPLYLGLWVFGDGNAHWLRGKITDGAGKEHTINFTEEGGLNWTGWKYVKANIPSGIALPIKFDQIYLVEPVVGKQGKGTIYLDKLQAVYNESYEEPIYKDVPSTYPSYNEIKYLSDRNVISGYPNGEFKPSVQLKRLDAAILLSRAMNLDTENAPTVKYKDISQDNRFYKEVAAVTAAKIMNGKSADTFDPNSPLTRAEMAVILQRAFKLQGSSEAIFTDVRKGSFGYDAISALYTEKITEGFPDKTYRPAEAVTRVQYSLFLYRSLTK